MSDTKGNRQFSRYIVGLILVFINAGLFAVFYFLRDFSMELIGKINTLFRIQALVDWLDKTILSKINGDITAELLASVELKITLIIVILALVIINALVLLIMRQKKFYGALNILFMFGMIGLIIFANTNSLSIGSSRELTKTIRFSESSTVPAEEEDVTIELTNLSIDFPSYFTDESMLLVLDEIDYSNDDTGFDIRLLNVNGDQLHELENYMEINIPLDKAEVDADNLDSIDYTYYDPESKDWLDVAWYYNTDTDNIVLLTNHLTEFRQEKQAKTDEELLGKLATPVFQYTKERGIYVKGSTPAAFDMKSLQVEKGWIDSAIDGLKFVKGSKEISGDLECVKLLSAVEQTMSFKYDDMLKSTRELIDPDKIKVNTLQKFLYGAEETASAGKIAKGLTKFTTGLGYADFLANAYLYYDEISKGTDEGDFQAGYIAAKQSASLLAPVIFGPYGFLVDPAIFIVETGIEEINYYSDEATKDAYYQFYTSKKYSRPTKYWYDRFDEIMKYETETPYDIKEAIQYLDEDINGYLYEFWYPENKTARDEIGVGILDLNAKEKEQLVKTFKKDASIYGLEQSIVDRYIEKLRKSAMEYQILLAKAYYENVLNSIVEIDIKAEGYELKKSKVNVYADEKLIWEGTFDKDGLCEFRSRYYQLLPEDLSSVQSFYVESILVDEYGQESESQQEILLLDLGEKITFEYTYENLFAVKILNKKADTDINNSYQFDYEFVNEADDDMIPDRIEWKASDGTIDANGLYTPKSEGKHTITLKAYYDAYDVVHEDTTTIVVTGAETPTEDPSEIGAEITVISDDAVLAILEQTSKGSPPAEPGFELTYESFTTIPYGGGYKPFNSHVGFTRKITYDDHYVTQSYSVFHKVTIYDEKSLAKERYDDHKDDHIGLAEADKYKVFGSITIDGKEAFYVTTLQGKEYMEENRTTVADDRIYIVCLDDNNVISTSLLMSKHEKIMEYSVSLMTIEHAKELVSQLISGLDALQ